MAKLMLNKLLKSRGEKIGHEMIKIMFILVAIALFILAGVLYIAFSSICGPLIGTPAELSVYSLIDNDNFDYMDVQVVKEGSGDYFIGRYTYFSIYVYNEFTGFYGTKYTRIRAEEGVNFYRYSDVRVMPPEGDNIRFYFLENIVDAGKTYHIKIQAFQTIFSGDVACA